jgi:hypothetical protein
MLSWFAQVHAAGGNDHILSLALNSLQRLHAGQLRAEEEEEDEEEEDSDEGNRQADDLEVCYAPSGVTPE